MFPSLVSRGVTLPDDNPVAVHARHFNDRQRLDEPAVRHDIEARPRDLRNARRPQRRQRRSRPSQPATSLSGAET